jgi:hypothetical protein
MASLQDLIALKDRIEPELLARPGVTGVDVGYKEVGGRTTDELSIRVHVAQKRKSVPKGEQVPAQIDGVPTDVLERKYELQVVSMPLDFSAQADTVHYAALVGGISMGPSRVIDGHIFAGTLGAIVIDKATNQHAALTNFHVACVDSGWHAGDRMVQPSRIDTGVVPSDEFGAILRATLSSAVDGSLISIDGSKTSNCAIAEIGTVKGTKAATMGMTVRKRGRTTGLTYGSVDGLSLTVNVDYGDGIGTKTLTNQVSIKSDTTKNPMFSDHGDSGSVIVDDSGYVVALLFAGAGTGTVGNPIAAVLSELNIAMCVGKGVVKDLKDGHKDLVKDGGKDVAKDKELRKDLVKDKDLRKDVKDKDVKEVDTKPFKDLSDNAPKRIGENIPGPGPIERPGGGGGGGPLESRLAALEAQLANLTSFISGELRPDLRSGAFAGEADMSQTDLAELRAALEQQAADAAQAKAELDGYWG